MGRMFLDAAGIVRVSDVSNSTLARWAKLGYLGEHLVIGEGTRGSRQFYRDDLAVVLILRICARFGANPARAAGMGRAYRAYIASKSLSKKKALILTDREGEEGSDPVGHCIWTDSGMVQEEPVAHFGPKNDLRIIISPDFFRRKAEEILENA